MTFDGWGEPPKRPKRRVQVNKFHTALPTGYITESAGLLKDWLDEIDPDEIADLRRLAQVSRDDLA